MRSDDQSVVYFSWPDHPDRASQGPLIDASVWDEIAEMIRASQLIAGVPTESILWRRRPEWVRERDFERQCTKSWLTMRGAFLR